MRFFVSALAVVCLVFAACGGGGGTGSAGGGGGGSGGGGGPVVLLDEDFGGTLATNWMLLSSGSGQAVSDNSDGNPLASLLLSADTTGVRGGVRTFATFPTEELSISFDARFEAVGGSHGLEVWITSIQGGGNRASVSIFANSVMYDLLPLGFHRTTTNPVSPDGAFHRFTLEITASGQASWYRDGFLQHQQQQMPIEDVFVQVFGPTGNSSGPGIGRVDNVLVTAP